MLTADQREELRTLIQDQIRQLEESVATLEVRVAPEEPDASVGRISRMDSLVNQGTAEGALQEARRKLGRLHEKLGKVDDPEFGKCASCGQWIPMERLRAAPDRGVCVPCLKRK